MERILWNFKFLTFHNSQNTISITCVHPNTLNHLGKDEKFKWFFCESKIIPNLNVLPPVASCIVGDNKKLYFFQCKIVLFGISMHIVTQYKVPCLIQWSPPNVQFTKKLPMRIKTRLVWKTLTPM